MPLVKDPKLLEDTFEKSSINSGALQDTASPTAPKIVAARPLMKKLRI
jgi:hypothetical protein